MGDRNKPCEKCRSLGHDKTGDHLWLMQDGVTWCCDKPYHPRLYVRADGSIEEGEDRVKSFAELIEEMGESEVVEERETVFVHTPLTEPYRSISPEVYAEFNVTGTYDGGALVGLRSPLTVKGKTIADKVRTLPKDFWISGKTKGHKVELFGQSLAKKSKRLIITEGEIDALSIAEAFTTVSYAVPTITSLPLGANMKVIGEQDKFISSYKELVVCGDNDDAGIAWKKEMASLYPLALFMDLGEYKDANEVLMDGHPEVLIDAYYRAEMYRPDSLVDISKLKMSLAEPIPMGYSTPWASLDELTYGISKGAIISVAAAPSAGKTIFVRAIHKHLMDTHGIKVGIYSLEESPETVLRNLVAYEMGVPIGVPGTVYDAVEAEKVASSLEKSCMIYDSSHYNGNWTAMATSMRMYCSLGMQVAIVDPVSSLVVGKSASEGNELLGTIMGDMIKITQETGLCVILVNHLNNAKGKPHEEGGRVLASEMTGSRSQYRYSSLILGLERDLLNEDEEIRDTLKVRVLKSRLDGSKSGRVCSLKYNQMTKKLEEIKYGFS